MLVTYMDHMGSDLTVVNAARVSFDKQSDWVQDYREEMDTDEFGRGLYNAPPIRRYYGKKYLSEKDTKLINYLAREGHWLPFRHPHISFHCKAPLFVARQAGKHQVGMSWSEVSRRYVDDEPEFYIPEVWRKRASDKKQGSSDDTIEVMWKHSGWTKDPLFDPCNCPIEKHHTLYTDYDEEVPIDAEYKYTCVDAFHTYQDMLKAGVAPEQARMVLPQSMYTEWVWTGSLLSWSHFVKLRTSKDAQKEIQDFANMFVPTLEQLYPVSWKALMS